MIAAQLTEFRCAVKLSTKGFINYMWNSLGKPLNMLFDDTCKASCTSKQGCVAELMLMLIELSFGHWPYYGLGPL